MRDDIAPANIGQSPNEYDRTFFWNSYRKLEMFFSQMLAKGPITSTTVTADSVVAGTVSASGDATIGGVVRLTGTGDVSPTSIGHPFQIGLTSGLNTRIDNNEFQAVNNGIATSANLNISGGQVNLGAAVGGGFVASPISANYGQIIFPATQNPSADANTLDDYRENIWTPNVDFTSGSTGLTYTATREGVYVKVGQMCIAAFDFGLATKGTSVGTLRINNLPFLSANLVANQAGSIGYCSGMIAGHGLHGFYVSPNTTNCLFTTRTSTGITGATDALCTDATRIIGSVVYRTAA